MEPSVLRAMIRNAIRGGVVTGLAIAGCGNSHAANTPEPQLQPPAITAGTGAGRGRADNSGATTGAAGMSGSGTGGGTVAENCHTNPVGTCCTEEVCLTLDGVAAVFGQLIVDDDAGVLTECPVHGKQTGFCTFYEELTSASEDRCCYMVTSGGCCGRPLLVGDRPLAAHLRTRSDWAGVLAPVAAVLDPRTRAELARAWLADARMEHASIASFARFTLQALSLGAPADLIADTQRAALDEVEHARACFALASRYAGQPIGPGEFPMDGVLAAGTLAEAAAATVREGCVAETIAALQAQTQLAWATDAQARAALVRIAADEARHAELAWRFVRWAVDAGGAPVRSAAADAFAQALDRVHAEPLRSLYEVSLGAWHDHGRLTPVEERSAWLAAVRDVIEPCARDLLA
jgi:hypothetical protein